MESSFATNDWIKLQQSIRLVQTQIYELSTVRKGKSVYRKRGNLFYPEGSVESFRDEKQRKLKQLQSQLSRDENLKGKNDAK
ncbi:uncharacterized protein MONOS_18552 [Monocercomonoides exilis]|uniref:uncharacterized protein n=1 Tax=Monocercomonoides exilis TaxID=2049356 RepID=UPI003559C731|nr:hypothetical protein MONOS_18552 [Monocercomonoides exilis]